MKDLIKILCVVLPISGCDLLPKTDWVTRNVSNESVAFELNENNFTTSGTNVSVESSTNFHGDIEYQLSFKPNKNESRFSIAPDRNWNWSDLGDINFATDISNPTNESIQVYIFIYDAAGGTHIRSVPVPANYKGTYYALLKGPQLSFDSGLREDPKSWKGSDHKMFWMRGAKNLQLDKVSKIEFVVDPFHYRGQSKQLILSNFRVRNNPEHDAEYLTQISDAYGQSYKFNYANKVTSDKQLKQMALEEIKALKDTSMFADRSQYGGYLKGPKLEATGYFRTTKIDGKWWMVDPEGYLFFSNALANIRIANTTTTTGIDFKDDSVRYVDPEDVTPEDSVGIRPVAESAQASRYVSSPTRRDMFSWLPEYNHPLANHYSYRRSVHRGPIKHGETYSFYQANLERRYGERYPDSYLDDWRDITIKRMKNWGFTSFGNWVDNSFYQLNRMPYFANGWIIGDYKTISPGKWAWKDMPDPFDPEFERRAMVTVEAIAEEVKNNPWCIGVFIDNEKIWGDRFITQKRYGIAINALRLNDQDSPTKAQFSKILKKKYGSVKKLNSAWNTEFKDWQQVSSGVTLPKITDAIEQDLSVLSYTYAKKYFKTVHDALEKVLPNHMYMGVRMAHWGMTDESMKAAAEYVDVLSFNYYKEGLHTEFWNFLNELDKPSVIGEFHIGATSDTGLYHPGLIHASNQEERARMYKDYVRSVLNNKHMVGVHWFQYIDSPLTGRAVDGENYNTGFVSMADVPYQEMVEAAQQVNKELYRQAPTK